jgi:hypothetical protein
MRNLDLFIFKNPSFCWNHEPIILAANHNFFDILRDAVLIASHGVCSEMKGMGPAIALAALP